MPLSPEERRERHRISNLLWYEKNREDRLAYNSAYWEVMKDHIKADPNYKKRLAKNRHTWYMKNKDYHNEYCRIYYQIIKERKEIDKINKEIDEIGENEE